MIESTAIREHITRLHETARGLEGTLVLASYGQDPQTGRNITPKVQHFAIGDIERMTKTAEAWAEEPHRNVYCPLAVAQPGTKKRGKAEDYNHILGLCADFDDELAHEYASRLPMPASVVIESSQGRFQAQYFFDKPATSEQAASLAKSLQALAGCDHCTSDLIHVWRVPGCLNWPNQKKVAEGRPASPQQVKIASPWRGKVSLEVLQKTLLEAREVAVASVSAPQATHSTTVDEKTVSEALEFIPADVDYACWIRILAALHSEGLSHLAHAWSAKSPQYTTEETNQKLQSFKRSGVSIGTLFHVAKKYGYQPREWADPLPLRKPKAPDQASIDDLPENLSRIIQHFSSVVQIPRDVTLGLCLSVISAAIGKRQSVQLPTHGEPSPIWTCSILEPGSRKSEAFKVVTSPLADMQNELQENWKTEHARWQVQAEISEETVRAIKQKLKAGKGDRETLQAELLQERLCAEDEPQKPVLWVSDYTVEGLRKMISTQGSIGLFSAEGGGILEAFGRYNGAAGCDLSFLLAAHAGDNDSSVRVNENQNTTGGLATIGIVAQSDVLRKLGRNETAKGRGFVDRFLFICPDDPRGCRDYRNVTRLNPDVMAEWGTLIRRIFNADGQKVVECTEGASEAWLQFAEAIERRQAEDGDLRPYSAFASKLAGLVGRISLSLNACTDTPKIEEATMQAAIDLGFWALEHHHHAVHIMRDTRKETEAEALLRKLETLGKQQVRCRDVVAMRLPQFASVDAARRGLETLAEHEYCRAVYPERKSQRGAAPKLFYELNPRHFAQFWA